jgi:two-component sensor histidine kinase
VNRFISTLFIFILASNAVFPDENPYIRHYGIVNGLPTNTVYHVSQDSLGFLWFSTDAGVVKYDGNYFENFRKKNGLSDKEILRTQQDSQGRMWIFSFNGGIHFYQDNKIHSEADHRFLKEMNSEGLVLGFYEPGDGSLIFYSPHDSLVCLHPDQTISRFMHSVLGRIYFISSSSDGKILFITRNGLYTSSLIKDKPVLIESFELINLFPAANSSFIVHTSYDELIGYTHEKQIFSVQNPFKTKQIITAHLDDKGMLWAGTFETGVYVWQNGEILFNIPIIYPQVIFSDKSNNIWITSMNDAIYKIKRGFTTSRHTGISLFEGRGITAVHSVNPDLLLISNGESIFQFQHGKISPLEGVTPGSYTDIITNFGDELFFGNRNDALYVLNLRKGNANAGAMSKNWLVPRLFHFYVKGYSINGDCTEMCIHHINQLFIYKSGMLDRPDTVQTGSRIYSAFYNSNGNLIVNTQKAVYILDNDSLRQYEELKVFNGLRIDGHLVIDENRELYNVEGDHLWLLNGKKLISLSFDTPQPLFSPILKILYHEPFVYFTTSTHLGRIKLPEIENGNTEIEVAVHDVAFGHITDVLVRNDTLFIASEEGLTLIPAAEFNFFKCNLPVPYFKSIQSDTQKLEFEAGGEVELKGNSDIHIDFDATDFSEFPVRFEYMLEGADEKWNIAEQTSVVYKNLSPGTYNFKLKAGLYNMEWSSPAMLTVRIKPQLYQQPLFFLFCALIFWAILHYFIRRYRLNLKKREEISYKLITLEQKALRAMMNPHFIFNSLGSIQNYLLQNKAEEANLYLSQFARLIRQNLNSANAAYINLEDETDRLMNYLSLEKLRLDDKFEFEIVIDPDIEVDEVFIPSMIIQPFVENAVWHGISPSNETGHIKILFKTGTGHSLMVMVEDNGIGIRQSKQYFSTNSHISIGMETTQKRLQLLCKQHRHKSEIQFEEVFPGKPNPGTRVIFTIPFKADQEMA